MENRQINNNKILGKHLINQVFFNKYKLVKILGEGSFGMIFEADAPNRKVAFKFEKKRPNKRPLLKNESDIMIYLKGKGIPSVELYTEEDHYSIMIMQLLGKSLENLLKESENKKLSVKTVCLIGLEIVPILKFIHDKHIIHRDIKPDNFAIGYEDPCQIYILDFGLAKKFRSSKTLKQIPMIKHSRLTGTARYASINALKGYEQSRRDDLESLGYVLAYLLRGALPWQGMPAKTKEEKYAKILNKKLTITIESLLKNYPQELINYIKYCRILKYEQDPDYEYLIELFKNVIVNKLNDKIDYKFEWANNDDIENHKKYKEQSLDLNKIDTSSMINNINSRTIDNSKNNLSLEESNSKPKTQREKINYYEEVIDEIILIEKDKEKEKEKENISNNSDHGHNKKGKKKEHIEKRKHGQCCSII